MAPILKSASSRQGFRYRRLLAAACAIAIIGMVGYWVSGRSVRTSADDTLAQAKRCLRDRDNAGARQTLRWLLWFEPDHHEALLVTGVSLNADQQFAEAIKVLQRIPDTSDSAESAGVALGASLISDGQLERAETVLKAHLERFPWSIGARDRLVRLYLMELRKRDAIALLLDHWSRYPDDLVVLPDLLELEANVLTPQGYVASLEEADRAHPGQAPVLLALARAHAQMGMTDQAKSRFAAALALRPKDADTRILAAEFYLDLGELDLAATLLEESDVFERDDDRYWFLRCRIAERFGTREEAYALLEQALAARPNEETYLLTQAGLLRLLGRPAEAAEAAQSAARLAEDRKRLMILSDQFDRDLPDPRLCLEIADVLDRLGNPDQASGWRRVSGAVAAPNSVPRSEYTPESGPR